MSKDIEASSAGEEKAVAVAEFCKEMALSFMQSLALKKHQSFFSRIFRRREELQACENYITGKHVIESNSVMIADKFIKIVDLAFKKEAPAKKSAIAMKMFFEICQDFELRNPYKMGIINAKALQSVYKNFSDKIIHESMIAVGQEGDNSSGNISLEYSNNIMFGVFEEIFNAANKKVFSKNNIAVFKNFYRKGNPLFSEKFLSVKEDENFRMSDEVEDIRRYIAEARLLPIKEKNFSVTSKITPTEKPEEVLTEKAEESDWRKRSQIHYDKKMEAKNHQRFRREGLLAHDSTLTLKSFFVEELEKENVLKNLDPEKLSIDKFVSHFIGATKDFYDISKKEKGSADMTCAFFDAVDELLKKSKTFDQDVLAQIYKRMISVTQYDDVNDPAISAIQVKIDDKESNSFNRDALFEGRKEYLEAKKNPNEKVRPLKGNFKRVTINYVPNLYI